MHYTKYIKSFIMGSILSGIVIFIFGLANLIYFADYSIEELPILSPHNSFPLFSIPLFSIEKTANTFGLAPNMNILWAILFGGLLNLIILENICLKKILQKR